LRPRSGAARLEPDPDRHAHSRSTSFRRHLRSGSQMSRCTRSRLGGPGESSRRLARFPFRVGPDFGRRCGRWLSFCRVGGSLAGDMRHASCSLLALQGCVVGRRDVVAVRRLLAFLACPWIRRAERRERSVVPAAATPGRHERYQRRKRGGPRELHPGVAPSALSTLLRNASGSIAG